MKKEYNTFEIYARLLRLMNGDYEGQSQKLENFCMSHDYDRVLDALNLIMRENDVITKEFQWATYCSEAMNQLLDK